MGLLCAALLAGVHGYVILGVAAIFLLGIMDDAFQLSAIIRVIVEIGAAFLVLSSGMGGVELWTPGFYVAMLWVVLVSNAVNLIDGADGVAASVVGTTTLLGGLFLLFNGNTDLAILSFSIAAVCVGFLVYNWPPASIFMGDGGSLVLGYLLAIVALEAGDIAGSGSILVQYGVAFAFVAVPFVDASFVAMVRILVGQNPAKGGTHHIHHRLRLSGFSAPQTATLLAMLAAIATSSILLAVAHPTLFGLLLAFGATALILLEALLVHHTGFLPSKDGETAERRHLLRAGRLFKRLSPAPKVVADTVVVATSAAVAGVLTGTGPLTAWGIVLVSVLFAAVKVCVMWVFGLYRHRWLTSAGTPDLLRALASIVTSSAILAVVAIVEPALGVGARFIVVDFMAATLGLIGLRIGYRAFRSVLGIQQRSGTRVLLYGAGQGGAFAVREMRLNPDRGMNAVGFLDDDPAKKNAKTYGLTVFGDLQDLSTAVRKTRAEQVVICSSKMTSEQATAVLIACQALGVPCTRMTFEFDSSVSSGDGFQMHQPAASLHD